MTAGEKQLRSLLNFHLTAIDVACFKGRLWQVGGCVAR
jgi:hypothetical protein